MNLIMVNKDTLNKACHSYISFNMLFFIAKSRCQKEPHETNENIPTPKLKVLETYPCPLKLFFCLTWNIMWKPKLERRSCLGYLNFYESNWSTLLMNFVKEIRGIQIVLFYFILFYFTRVILLYQFYCNLSILIVCKFIMNIWILLYQGYWVILLY